MWRFREMMHYYQVGKLGKNILEEVGWESCICSKAYEEQGKTVFQVPGKTVKQQEQKQKVSYFSQWKINQPLRTDFFV